MKYIIRKLTLPLITIICCLTLCTSCREAGRVSYNVSKEADNFNVNRRLTVINTRTDTVLYTVEGRFSIQNNDENELEIIAEAGKGIYKKHFIYLNEYIAYIVEDLDGAEVDKYTYEVNYLPQTIQTIAITNND